jgi:hypothetical protein
MEDSEDNKKDNSCSSSVMDDKLMSSDARPETPRSVASSITTTTATPGRKNKTERIRHRQTNTNRSENGQSDATNTGTESEVEDYDDVVGGVPAGLVLVDEIKETGQEAPSVVENNNDNEAVATAASTNNESEGDVVEVLEEEQQLEGELKVADNESQSTKGLDEVLEQTPSAVNVEEAIGSASNEVLNYC